MHIRPAQAKDIPKLIQLGKQLLNYHVWLDREYYLLEDNFDTEFNWWLADQIGSTSKLLLVAHNDVNKIVGFISGFIKALYPWFRTKAVGHISYMYIDSAYRKRGVGKLLESASVTWFKSKNVSYVELYVEEKNDIGQKAWTSYDFLPFKKFLRKKI